VPSDYRNRSGLDDRVIPVGGTATRARRIAALAVFLSSVLAFAGDGPRPPPVDAQTLVVDRTVAASADDAEEYISGEVNLNSSDLELVRDTGHGNQTVGVRFGNLPIPQGATITAAHVQFQVDEASSEATSLAIRAQAVDHAPAFTTAARNISSRATTTASVAWAPPAWPTLNLAGPSQATPSLASVVQEVVARPGWGSGNALVITITGTGWRVAEAFDGSAASRLHVEYEPAAGLDGTPPDTQITAGPPDPTTNANGTFIFTATEAGSAFACAIDGGSFVPCTSPHTVMDLANGTHALHVRATDGAGNEDATPASRSWTVSVPAGAPGGVLVGAGDIASCGSSGDEATAALLDGIAGTVFTTGDNVYGGTGLAQYQSCYGPSWGRHLERTRPTPGNHDYDAPGAPGYYAYFGSSAGDPTKGYYSYDLGGWHVVVLNSNCAAVGGCGGGSAQEQWLRQDLTASSAACTVALWHHPRYSVGVHGDSAATQALWQAAYDHGVDLVLTGHDHSYQRFLPLDAAGRPDAALGITSIVVGTGGASHYDTSPGPNTVISNGATYGVLKLTLYPTGLNWDFVPQAGATFTDSGSLGCHGAPAGGDQTPPDTAVGGGPPDPTTSTSASFTFSSTEANSTFACSLDNAADAPCTSPRSYSGLAAGGHVFRVRATDPAGNTDATPASHAWTISGGGGGGGGGTVTFGAAADAQVVQGSPGTNYGGAAALVVDGSPASQAYLRFTVSGLSGSVTSARLRMYAFDPTTNGPRLFTTASSWNESTITWNLRPAAGSQIGNAAAISANTWVEFDVTGTVTADGSYSFHLAPDVTDGVDFRSREAAASFRPQLVVTTAAP